MDESTKTKQNFLPKIYFGLAVVSVILLALLWSVDVFFIYTFLAAGSFFFFLWMRNTGQIFTEYKGYEHKKQSSRAKAATGSLTDDIRYFLKRHISYPRSFKLIAKLLGFGIPGVAFLVIFFGGNDAINAEQHYLTGDQFYSNSQLDSAYFYYKRALSFNPDHEDSYYGLGNIMFTGEKYDSALLYYNKVLDLNPDYTEASYRKGQVYFNQQNYSLGLREAQNILDDDPDYNDAYLLAGDCYYFQKLYDSAMVYYKPAYDHGVRSNELCYIMAYICDTQGKTDRAIELYKEALEYDDTVTDIYRRLGELIPGEEGNYYRGKAVSE